MFWNMKKNGMCISLVVTYLIFYMTLTGWNVQGFQKKKPMIKLNSINDRKIPKNLKQVN